MTKLVQFWPVGKPIPRGWKLAKHKASHHTRFCVLIEKKPAKKRRAA